MATWVRSFSADKVGLPNSSLVGTADLDTDTAPGDFDPAGVTAVQLEFILSHLGTFATNGGTDTYVLQATEIQTLGATQLATVASSGTIENGIDTVVIDLTDNSPNTGASQADWESALFAGISADIATFNQTKGNDGVTPQILAASVTITITYTPGVPSKSGSGAIVETHTVVGTGDKQGLGTGAIVQGHTVVGAGASARFGAGSISHGHTVIATGSKIEDEDKSGSGAIVESHNVVATGRKEGSGTGNISHGHTVVAAGNKAATGTSAIAHGHTVVATGRLSSEHWGLGGMGVTLSGIGLMGIQPASEIVLGGSGSISHGHTVVASGVKNAKGVGSLVETHTVVAAGNKESRGLGSLVETHTIVATGSKAATGSTAISHGHTVTATGFKGAIGTGALSLSVLVAAEGFVVPIYGPSGGTAAPPDRGIPSINSTDHGSKVRSTRGRSTVRHRSTAGTVSGE